MRAGLPSPMHPSTRNENTTWIAVPGDGQDEAVYIVDTQTTMRVAMTCCSSMGRSSSNERDAALLAEAPRMARLLLKMRGPVGSITADDEREMQEVLRVAARAGVLPPVASVPA